MKKQNFKNRLLFGAFLVSLAVGFSKVNKEAQLSNIQVKALEMDMLDNGGNLNKKEGKTYSNEEPFVKNNKKISKLNKALAEETVKITSLLNKMKSNEEIADEVILGFWGSGDERVTKLKEAGYDYDKVQAIVHEKIPKPEPIKESQTETSYSSYSDNHNGGDARTAFEQIVYEKGLTQSEIDGWSYIISKESAWNVCATNPSSGAYGLPQSLPGSKMSSHGSDWRSNPRTQLLWMYDYMITRYGSIQGAVNFWNANHWY